MARVTVCLAGLGLVSIAAGSAFLSHSSRQLAVDVLDHLPRGSRIEDPQKDIVEADLNNDGIKEIVVFYVLQDGDRAYANIRLLKRYGSRLSTVWEDEAESWGFDNPTGVYPAKGKDRYHILAYRRIGASCPGVLRIYRMDNRAVQQIRTPWEGTCASYLTLRDLDGDGYPEIIFKTLKYGRNWDIYRWEGEQHIKSNKSFPDFYDEDLAELLRTIRSKEPAPGSARISWTEQVVEILILQRRFEEGIQLCQEVSKMIDDPAITTPEEIIKGDETPEMLGRIRERFERAKFAAKSRLANLGEQLYKLAGNSHRVGGLRVRRAPHRIAAHDGDAVISGQAFQVEVRAVDPNDPNRIPPPLTTILSLFFPSEVLSFPQFRPLSIEAEAGSPNRLLKNSAQTEVYATSAPQVVERWHRLQSVQPSQRTKSSFSAAC